MIYKILIFLIISNCFGCSGYKYGCYPLHYMPRHFGDAIVKKYPNYPRKKAVQWCFENYDKYCVLWMHEKIKIFEKTQLNY